MKVQQRTDLNPRSTRQRLRGCRTGLTAVVVGTLASQAVAAADLTSLSLEQLMEIKVVGASKYEQAQNEVAAAVSVVTRQEIKAFGWRTLAEVLTSLPGVHATYDRQYLYLGVRGFGLPGDTNTRVLVTINGNRVNDPNYDLGPIGRDFPLDLDLVERIEYIPGPGGAVYGQNAMFGVVNVVTRDGGNLSGGEVAAAWQSRQQLGEGRASWGRTFGDGTDVLVSVAGMHAQGQNLFFDFGAAGVSGVAAGMDGARDQEFFARVARGAWSFEYVDGSYRKDDPTGAYLSDPLVPGQYQADRYTIGQLQYRDGFAGDTLHLSARLFAGREAYRSILEYGGPVSFPGDSRWRGIELRLLSTAWRGHRAMVGIEAQDNHRQDQQVVDLARADDALLIAASGYRIGVYAQDEWTLGPSLSTTLGLRVDRNNATGTHTSPRVAMIWRPAEATSVKALYGRAHRAPNVGERDYDDGVGQVANLSLKGETIDTLEFVADHRFGSDLALRASAYQWKMSGLIVLGVDPASGLPQYQSGPPVDAHGLELSADKTWPGGARLRGSVSVQHANYDDGSRLLNSPRTLAKLNFSTPLDVAGLRLGWESRYDNRRLSLNGEWLGGWTLSNLHLSTAAVARRLELALTVANVFDKRYAHPGADINWQNAFEQDRRSVRLQGSLSF